MKIKSKLGKFIERCKLQKRKKKIKRLYEEWRNLHSKSIGSGDFAAFNEESRKKQEVYKITCKAVGVPPTQENILNVMDTFYDMYELEKYL